MHLQAFFTGLPAVLAGLALGLPALGVALLPRRSLGPAIAVWACLPIGILATVMIGEGALSGDQSAVDATFGDAMLALGVPVMLLWLPVAGIGFGLGLAIHTRLWHKPPAPAGHAPAPPPDAPFPSTGRALPLVQAGLFAVEFEMIEWGGNGHWIHGPRVTDVSTDAVLLDLWHTSADATARYSANGTLVLEVYLWSNRTRHTVTLDPVRRMYNIETHAAEGPLQHLQRAFPGDVVPAALRPQPVAQRDPTLRHKVNRQAGLILLAALIAIGGVAVVARLTDPPGVSSVPLRVAPKP